VAGTCAGTMGDIRGEKGLGGRSGGGEAHARARSEIFLSPFF